MDEQDKASTEDKKQKKETDDTYIGEGMCIGLCLGMLIGMVIFDNMTIGMSIGLCLGLTVGGSIKRKS